MFHKLSIIFIMITFSLVTKAQLNEQQIKSIGFKEHAHYMTNIENTTDYDIKISAFKNHFYWEVQVKLVQSNCVIIERWDTCSGFSWPAIYVHGQTGEVLEDPYDFSEFVGLYSLYKQMSFINKEIKNIFLDNLSLSRAFYDWQGWCYKKPIGSTYCINLDTLASIDANPIQHIIKIKRWIKYITSQVKNLDELQTPGAGKVKEAFSSKAYEIERVLELINRKKIAVLIYQQINKL